jgi:hypothetical protein
MEEGIQLKDAFLGIGQYLMKEYWGKIWKILSDNPALKKTFPAFIANPEKFIIYFGKDHIAIEYVGPVYKSELEDSRTVSGLYFDYTKSDYLMDDIIGFQFDGTSKKRQPLSGIIENLFVPSSKAFDVLQENHWNFAAQSMAMGINMAGLELQKNQFVRIINGFFYGTDKNGLIVRHIKWLDAFPVEINDLNNDKVEEFKIRFWPNMEERAAIDSRYCYPQPIDREQEKLTILNRFIELFSSAATPEPDITRFLAEEKNQFILKLAFFAKEIHSEKECAWVNEERKPIKPDFFVTAPNGYSDIVEFKLPTLKSSSIVGSENREAFSAEINSYIAQTRTYMDYFADFQNRKLVKEVHGFNVLHPKRYLVIGRRWMFSTDQWRVIEKDYKDFEIKTYDDIVDGVLSQLYS